MRFLVMTVFCVTLYFKNWRFVCWAKPPWRQDWLATSVYFKTCSTKPCQVGHRPFLVLSGDYNFLRSTVNELNIFIQYSHCQIPSCTTVL